MSRESSSILDAAQIRALPKLLLHEHLDCSLRPESMLEFWLEDGWQVPSRFPAQLKGGLDNLEMSEAAEIYAAFLAEESSRSLANYVAAINEHVLPLMQSAARLERICRERIADAEADGICAMELRFAPQLHTKGGLSLSQVMDAVISGLSGARMPVRLIICALRHEDGKMAEQLVELAVSYKQHTGCFDLAGDEAGNPGVLNWWLEPMQEARKQGIVPTIHLWETNEPQNDDLVRLEEFDLQRLGHGIRGQEQGMRILEVCPSSNIVTGQVADFARHPIDKVYRSGCRVTVNTDGTLFTRSDLSNEYLLLQKHFGWAETDFKTVNLTALAASSFPADVKAQVAAKLEKGYCAD